MPFDLDQISLKLQGYPTDIVDAFEAFARDDRFEAFESGFLGALGFLSDGADADAVRSAPDEARLREDLNVDSLAMVELVFLVEDSFGIAIQDGEIQGVRTVADFKRLAREKLASRAA